MFLTMKSTTVTIIVCLLATSGFAEPPTTSPSTNEVPSHAAPAAQTPDPLRLLGAWACQKYPDKLTFSEGGKVVLTSMGDTLTGRYEIDSTKSPNLLVFYFDSAPARKVCASIDIKSDTEIHVSHLCDGSPAQLAKQPVVTFIRE